jgi:hypothetical protein
VQVVELLDEALDVAGAVAVAVLEAADQHLVEHRSLEPERVAALLEADELAVLVLGRGGHEVLRTVKTWAGSWNGSSRT